MACMAFSVGGGARVAVGVAAARKAKATTTRRTAARAAVAETSAPVDVVDFEGTPTGQATVTLKTAGEKSEYVVHRKLVAELANRRQGSANTKTRSEVRGGGRKPFAQKGTGRARAGSIRTPLKPGGGVIHGPKPRDFSKKMNKKERRLAISSALLNAAGAMTVVSDFESNFSAPNTKMMAAALSRWGLDTDSEHVLLITNAIDDNVVLSGRNISRLCMSVASNLNVYDILRADKIVATESALATIMSTYGPNSSDE